MDLAAAGRTFLLFDRRTKPHLWFVLTDPDPQTQKVIVVALVSAKSHTDSTVALLPGDHPFITHESHVDYGTATFMPANKIHAAVAAHRAIPKEDLSPEVLARVRAGAVASSHTPNDVARHCTAAFTRGTS